MGTKVKMLSNIVPFSGSWANQHTHSHTLVTWPWIQPSPAHKGINLDGWKCCRISYHPQVPEQIRRWTATRWLHGLGFQPSPAHKGIYLDGHKSENVVKYRTILRFLSKSAHAQPHIGYMALDSAITSTQGYLLRWAQKWKCCQISYHSQVPEQISTRTAIRWLHGLGFEPSPAHKGICLDGHKREDVVKYRKLYLRKLEILESTHSHPPPAVISQIKL